MKNFILVLILLFSPWALANVNTEIAPIGLVYTIIYALVGGVLLNLMPCVFPVLSLKIITLKSDDNKKMQSIFYTLGIVCGFLVIALLMIAFQNVGFKVGWGFQMQSPYFITCLIYLFTLVALNLFSFFDVPISLQKKSFWVYRNQYLYAFSTGVLVCIVATPCSAPFMATAIGIALTKSALEILIIFISLGVGLALPYLLVCFIPILSTLLPKPGSWMETTKQFLGFPILLSIVWLLWVLGKQIPFDGVIIVLTSLCLLIFTIWLLRKNFSIAMRSVIILLSVFILFYPISWIKESRNLDISAEHHKITFSHSKLDKLINQKQSVFVNVTASWCITCKINEKIAIKNDAVIETFKKYKIILLKADWTNRDKNILNYLKKFGRAGVPLYVYYHKGKDPIILPQVLSPSIVTGLIEKANNGF